MLWCRTVLHASCEGITQLQVQKIPNKYILKRYTWDARSFVEWGRNDVVKGGQDENNEQLWFAKLVSVVMDIVRVGSKSEYAYEKTLVRANALRALIETIPANVTTTSNTPNEGPDVAETFIVPQVS
jgi:hypothetical protein